MRTKNKILGIKESVSTPKDSFNPLTREYVWRVQKRGSPACYFDGFMVVQMIDRSAYSKVQAGARHFEYHDYTFDFVGKNQ